MEISLWTVIQPHDRLSTLAIADSLQHREEKQKENLKNNFASLRLAFFFFYSSILYILEKETVCYILFKSQRPTSKVQNTTQGMYNNAFPPYYTVSVQFVGYS